MRKQFTLGKNERLKSRKQIGQLFAEGKSFVVNPFRVHYAVNRQSSMVDASNSLQFGIGVSSKNFKKAVDRNRIKRLTREAWRLQKNDPITIGLQEKLKVNGIQLNVFFIYTAKLLPDFATTKGKVAVALKKLSDKIDENISANP